MDVEKSRNLLDFSKILDLNFLKDCIKLLMTFQDSSRLLKTDSKHYETSRLAYTQLSRIFRFSISVGTFGPLVWLKERRFVAKVLLREVVRYEPLVTKKTPILDPITSAGMGEESIH